MSSEHSYDCRSFIWTVSGTMHVDQNETTWNVEEDEGPQDISLRSRCLEGYVTEDTYIGPRDDVS